MMPEIRLRLYEELNDFLPFDQRKRTFAYRLSGTPTVKELLASLKVPGDQVELVLINGDSVGFSHRIKANDFVSIYPVFESFDVTTLSRARKKPLRRICFIMRPGLLRLARYLRLLGFDVLDSGSWSLEKTVRMAEKERRILLTRNPALMKYPGLSRIHIVREAIPKRQLAEVLSRFDLYDSAHLSSLQSIIGTRHQS